MAISSPLLEASIDGAHGVLLSIQGGSDLGLFEINEAAQLVSNSAAVDANIIFGAVIDDALGDEVRVTVIAAGFDEQRPSRPATAANVSGSGYGGLATGGTLGGSGSAGTSGTGTNGTSSTGPSASASRPHVTSSWATSRPDASSVAGTSGEAASGSATADAQALPATHKSASAAPASAVPASYVPAPVAFVSGDDDDYQSADGTGYATGDGTAGPPAPAGIPGAAARPEVPRSAPEKSFDSSAPRRRPVVFEEEDDLDVPDFLK
jgi:cell division protein FtsZ